MEFGFLTIILLVLATALTLAGVKILLKPDWFIEFLRGFVGFGLIGVALVLILSGLNIASYNSSEEGKVFANISFELKQEQQYEATLVYSDTGIQHKALINGDLWQSTARNLSFFGSDYVLISNLAGQFYSFEQQRSAPNLNVDLPLELIGFDLWSAFRGSNLGIIAANSKTSAVRPLANGAIYSIQISNNNIVAKPVSEAAVSAVNKWQ